MGLACTTKTQPKLIKKSHGYNSRDLTLALCNIDSQKGLYCGYMDGNLYLMGAATSPPHPGVVTGLHDLAHS